MEPADLGKRRDRALISAAGSTLVSRLVNALAMVLGLAVAARHLSQDELGVVAVLTSLTLLLGLTDLGLGNLMMTRLPAARAREDLLEQQSIVAAVLSTLTAVGVLLGGLGAVSAYVVDWPSLLGVDQGLAGPTRTAVCVFFLLGGIGVPGAVGPRVLTSLQRSAEVQIWTLGASIISLALTVVCAAVDAPLWAWVASLAGILGVSAALQTALVLGRQLPELRPSSLRMPVSVCLAFMRASAMYAVLGVSAGVMFAVDALVVSAVLGPEQAAVFALATRIFGLVGSTLSLAGMQMWAALSDAIARQDLIWIRSRYKRVLLLSAAVTASACAVLVAVGRELTRVWVGADLVPPWSLLLSLALATVCQTVTIQASYLLAAAERVNAMAVAGVIAAVVNLGASIALTHRYGVAGPALGSLVALVLVLAPAVVVLTVKLFRDLGTAAPAVASIRAP